MRVDKYLWAVRIYKTRQLASEACKSGRVELDGKAVKPAKVLEVGGQLEIRKGELRVSCKILAFPRSRVGAPLVPEFGVIVADGGTFSQNGKPIRINKTIPGDKHEKQDRKISSRRRKEARDVKMWE